MSIKLAVISSLFTLLISASDPALAAAGWTDFGPITELNQQPAFGTPGAGLILVEVEVTSNPSGCSVPNRFFFSVNRERLFVTLLAAQMFSRNVRIYTTGNCHHPLGHAELDGLIVR
jgi:hypothetical protein